MHGHTRVASTAQANPKVAISIIQKYSELLNDLAHQHYDLQSQLLVLGISMFKQRTSSTHDAIKSKPEEPILGPSKDVKPSATVSAANTSESA